MRASLMISLEAIQAAASGMLPLVPDDCGEFVLGISGLMRQSNAAEPFVEAEAGFTLKDRTHTFSAWIHGALVITSGVVLAP